MDSRETSASLRRKAQAILDATGWPDLFTRRFGTCALTGSARYDLMVWPDIDIHMPVDPSYRIDWAAMLADLNAGLERAGLRLHKAQMWDDYVDPHPLGAGLYWGIQFVEADGTAWKSDIWGWEPDDYARRQAKDAELVARLEVADRDLILRLKTEAMARPDYYGPVVGSWHIYQAVLSGGSSLVDVERWKAENPQWQRTWRAALAPLLTSPDRGRNRLGDWHDLFPTTARSLPLFQGEVRWGYSCFLPPQKTYLPS